MASWPRVLRSENVDSVPNRYLVGEQGGSTTRHEGFVSREQTWQRDQTRVLHTRVVATPTLLACAAHTRSLQPSLSVAGLDPGGGQGSGPLAP